MRKLLLLLLLAAPAWAQLGSPVLLDLTDRSTVARTGNVVLAGVPIPEVSAITDVRNLAITTAPAGACAGGAQVDSHRLVTERWHGDPTDTTKSIKWVLVAAVSPTLAGNGTAHLCIADRSGADPGTATTVTTNTSAACPVSGTCYTVDTGVNKYWIRTDSFNLFDQVKNTAGTTTYVSHSTAGGIVAVTSAGTFTSATVPTATPGIPGYAISLEEPSGASTANEDGANLYAQIKVSGALWNGTTPKFTYVGRLFFFGGDGMWLWKGTNIYSEDMFATANQPTSVGLFLPTALGNSLTAKFGTQYGTPATTQSIAFTNTDDVYLSQYDHGNTSNNVASVIGTTSTVATPWNLCDDTYSNGGSQPTGNLATASSAKIAGGQGDCPNASFPGFRGVKNTTTQFSGNQSDGWVSCDDGTNQANVWMRDNWQTYPNEIECNGPIIGIYQWPKHGDSLTDSRSQGDLTTIFNYKRDMALSFQVGFQNIWPWAPGAAMNMTPISPNPNRGIATIISTTAGAPLRIAGSGVNYQSNDAGVGPLGACTGSGCRFWTPCTLTAGVCTYDSTKARKVFFGGLTVGWVPLNGFKMAMLVNDGSGNALLNSGHPVLDIFNTDGTIVDASAFGTISPANCLGGGPPNFACALGTIDTQGDMQPDSFARYWEIAGNFTSHAGATPGNDAARWRDTLLFTNPSYYVDTSLAFGHAHAQDTANFPRVENEITNYFNNLYKRQIVLNEYGIYWGLENYGSIAAGAGSRTWASVGRRRYDIPMWLQFFRTGDPTFFHRAQSMINATEVTIQHPNNANPITGALGTYSCSGSACGVDQTGTTVNNIYYDTKHYVDANNNLVIKHDGSTICSQGNGNGLFQPLYNKGVTGWSSVNGSDVNPCSDGQVPWLEYPTTTLHFNYVLTGDPRSKELIQSIGKHLLYVASGNRTLTITESAGIYNGACAGRAFGGGMQASTDAAEIIGNSVTSYIDIADGCFKGNIQDNTSGVNVWTQNPTGIIYDDNSVGPKSAVPSANAHTHYGTHMFVETWADWNFAEYASYKNYALMPAPSYATGHPSVSIDTALINMGHAQAGYFNTTALSGGLYTYQFPNRPVSDSYARSTDPEFLKYIKRTLDFHSHGADDIGISTGCTQTGTIQLTGDTPTVPGAQNTTPICGSPTGSAATATPNPTTLFPGATRVNPNALSESTPDIHNGGRLALSFPYLEYPLIGQTLSPPDFPPSFVVVPQAGANNAPLQWITSNPGTAAITFYLALRIGVNADFGNLSIVTPASPDFSLTVKNPSNVAVNGITVKDSANDTYTGNPTAVFKTPTQMWPPAAGGGAAGFWSGGLTNTFITCGTAAAPPSINYTAPGGVPDGLNNKDNRVFLVTIPGPTVAGEYSITLTAAAPSSCPDPNGVQIPEASLLGISTGNADLVICQNGCTSADTAPGKVNNFEQVDNGSVLFINVPAPVTKLQTDSSTKHAVIDPSDVLYRGGTIRSNVTPNVGQWPIKQNGGWTSQASMVLTFGGVGGVKPLASQSPQTFYDSSNFSNQTFVPYKSNGFVNGSPVTLNISGCAITVTGILHNGTVGVAYSPTVTYGNTGCGAGTPAYSNTGNLPPGMTLDPSTGVLSGTPTLASTYNFTVVETGTATPPPVLPQLVVINPGTLCSINAGQNPLTSGNQNQLYSYTIATTNCQSPQTWSISVGSLPAGLTIDNTGKISGTPTGSGTSSFTARVVDNAGTQVDLPTSINIVPAPLCVIANTSPLANGAQTVAYGPVTLTGSNCGTVTGAGWVVTSGALPAGLTLHSTTGVIDGTPSGSGTSTFTVQFNETGGTNPTKQFQITISTAPTINPPTLPNGGVGSSYRVQLTATGGTSPYSWSVLSGTLPNGVTLGASTGLLSGTPTVANTFTFQIQVQDFQSATGNITYTVLIGGPGSARANEAINGAVH